VTGLKLARGLTLDADYVGGGTFALLAKKGAGKTYAMRVLAEEFWKAKVPFVALDPMDAFWGLRSSADGEGEGIPVAIFGGPHADAPLEQTGGKLMADLVVEESLSMVLSTKHFGSRAAERRFAMDFLERLYRRNSELVHVLIDEADLFAPQKPRRDDQHLLAITENIVRRGRNNGIGVTMATQRPAVLNKDVLTQVDGLIVMRMLGPQDRDAIDAWVGEHGDTGQGKDVKGTLPDLATGEAWVWVPELSVLERTKIRASRTFDSSPTRRRGAEAREPKTYADVDLSRVEKQMAETIERAKAEDPRELRKRIAELERRRGEMIEVEKIVEKRVEVPIEVPAISDQQVQDLGETAGTMRDLARSLSAQADQIEEALRHVREARSRIHREPADVDRAAARPDRRHAERPPGRARPAPRREPAAEAGAARLGKGELKVLGVLAEFPEGRTQNEVAFLAGYSANASTIGVILSKLRLQGLVELGQPIRPTPKGLAQIGGPVARPTGQDLVEHWLQHPRMGEGMRRVFQQLLELYPEEPTHDELCEMTGYSPIASTMGVILSKLRKLGLVERGHRRVAGDLMEAISA
jgi:hypothetical protein